MKQKSYGFAVQKVRTILLSVICTLLTWSSYCQSDIKTQQKQDSLVVLPKQLVTYLIQDLVQADSDRVELSLMGEQLFLQEEMMKKQDDMIKLMSSRNKMLFESYELCSIDRDSIANQLILTNKKLVKTNKAKKIWTTIATISMSLFIIRIL